MKAIFKRELAGFFHTGLGYLFLFVFAALCGVVFYLNNLSSRSSDMGGFFSVVSYQWILLSPILVMRLLPAEKKNGTQPLLMTSSVTCGGIIAAKYAAAFCMLCLSLLTSLVFPAVIAAYGAAYPPEILTGYLGLMLYGAAYLALDLLVSVFARTTPSAFLLAFGTNLLVRLSGVLAEAVHVPALKGALSILDMEKRHVAFIYGQLSFSAVIYYVVVAAVCLFAAAQAMSLKRWRRA